jgi:15-cis-phytoene synthase
MADHPHSTFSVTAPSMLDPRVMLMVPTNGRAALSALWRLEARLFDIVVQRREEMLAQLKLAWWRDRLGQLATEPASLPKGEPLLAELAATWGGSDALIDMADGYEAAMFANDNEAALAAAELLRRQMRCAFAQIGLEAALRAWSLVRAGQMASSRAIADRLWVEATNASSERGAPRAVRTLERWSQLVAKHGAAAPARAEGWLLLRAGLGF